MEIKIIFVLLFVLGMFIIGLMGMRKTKNVGDFFLGGRNIGLWLSAFSYGTTYFSAVIFIGFAGKLGWLFGSKVLWIAFGNSILGSLLAWAILAKPTRKMTFALNVKTMPEFLAARYNSEYLKYFAAFVIFLFLTPYSASVYKGLSYLFEKNLNVSFDTALYFMAGLTALYLIMGGYHAVNFADFIQGTIMIFGALLMVFIITGKAGGFSAATQTITQNYPQNVPKAPPGYILLSLVILTSLGPWGMPQMVQKYYAIKNESIIPKAMIITTVFAIIISFVAYFCGALTHCFFDAARTKELGFDKLIPVLLGEHTPNWLNIIILLLVLSASMSTLSGLVLVSSSAIAIDFYQGKNPNEKREKNTLILMRVLCLVFIVISVLIAKFQVAYIVTLMSISWGLVAGCFLAPYLYGLFFKKGSTTACWICMYFVILLNIVLMYYYTKVGGKAKAEGMAPFVGSLSMILPLIIFPIASIIFPPKKEFEIK